MNKRLYKTINVLYKNSSDKRFSSEQSRRRAASQAARAAVLAGQPRRFAPLLRTDSKARSLTGEADNFRKADRLTKSDSAAVQGVGRATANKGTGGSGLARALLCRNPGEQPVAIP